MPNPTTYYTCQFKCGRKAQKEAKSVEQHENTCWKNPATRSCTTCQYEVYYEDSGSEPGDVWKVRSCGIDPDQKFEQVDGWHYKPITNCMGWSEKKSR